MTNYTAQTVEVTVGTLPKFRKVVTQHHVFQDGEYYGNATSLQAAQEIAAHLNAVESEYQQQLAASGLTEWEFQDQNSAG